MPEMKTLTMNGVKYTLPFAPDGYGLGVSTPSTTIEDCNTVTQNGWYRTSGSTLNQPIDRANWMRVDSHGTSYCHQTCFNDQYNGCIAERFMINGTWQPWEWVNPPMALDVEYRTTERWNGMVVYTKLIEFGAMPNATTGYVYNVIPVNAKITFFQGLATNGAQNLGVSSVAEYWRNQGYIGVKTTEDMSAWSATFVVKYTKD